MSQRHPRQAVVIWTQAGRLDRPLAVGNDVAVSEYDPLGLAGGPRRELDEGHVLRGCFDRFAGARDVIQIVDEKGPRAKLVEGVGNACLGGEGADAVEGPALE